MTPWEYIVKEKKFELKINAKGAKPTIAEDKRQTKQQESLSSMNGFTEDEYRLQWNISDFFL